MAVYFSPITNAIYLADQAFPVSSPIFSLFRNILACTPALPAPLISRWVQVRLQRNFYAAQKQQAQETSIFNASEMARSRFSTAAAVTLKPKTRFVAVNSTYSLLRIENFDPTKNDAHVTVSYTEDAPVNHVLYRAESLELKGICVGICTSRENGREFFLAENYNLHINGANCDCTILGIFEAMSSTEGKGQTAQMISEQIAAHLKTALEKNNAAGLTDQGIRSSLIEGFSILNEMLVNDEEVAEQYSSATLALLIDGKVWCANIGGGRVILNDDGRPVQLTKADCTKTMPGRCPGFAIHIPFYAYFARKATPGITCYSLPPRGDENRNRHLLLCSPKIFQQNHEHSHYKFTSERVAEGASLLHQQGRSCDEIAAILTAYPLPSPSYEGTATVMVAGI